MFLATMFAIPRRTYVSKMDTLSQIMDPSDIQRSPLLHTTADLFINTSRRPVDKHLDYIKPTLTSAFIPLCLRGNTPTAIRRRPPSAQATPTAN